MTYARWMLPLLMLACSSTTAPAADAAPDTAPPADVAPDRPADAPADAATCPLPEMNFAACTMDSDCATVARGCHCGQQPVVGVSRSNLALAARCEDDARRTCALGCPVQDGQEAQDGRSVTDGGVIAVRCERDAGAGSCRTYVP